MVLRDRNRPSVIVWGTRLDETASYPSCTPRPGNSPKARRLPPDHRRDGHPVDRGLGRGRLRLRRLPLGRTATRPLEPPIPGSRTWSAKPSERSTGRGCTAGSTAARRFGTRPRCTPRYTTSRSRTPRMPGCSAGAASTMPRSTAATAIWQDIKWPGVLDTFRVPKPGAAVLPLPDGASDSAGDPAGLLLGLRPELSRNGPGANTMIATNCDQLEIYVGRPATHVGHA